MEIKTIAVTGTPGTGKTELAKALAASLNLEYIDVNSLVKKEKLNDGYDKEKDCEIININRFNDFFSEKIKKSKKGMVIDSHLSHEIPKELIDICIVARCNITELKRRLEERKYSPEKIRENLDAEIFEICTGEARDNKHILIQVDTSEGFNIQDMEQRIIEKISRDKK